MRNLSATPPVVPVGLPGATRPSGSSSRSVKHSRRPQAVKSGVCSVKGVLKSALWGSAVAALLAAAPLWAAELKIGYVNYGQLLEQSPQAKVISDSMRSEFMPRQRELQTQEQTLRTRADKLQKDGATMSDDQRTREEKEVREGARELERKKQEAQD